MKRRESMRPIHTASGPRRRYCRATFVALVGVLLSLTASLGVSAQPVELKDGKYPSMKDYLVGAWNWERQEPRQTVRMRFGRDGGFFFHNLTLGLQHYGTFTTKGTSLLLKISRTCAKNGAQCESRNPAMEVDYALVPVSANLFTSDKERWERMRQR
jgi:hypothetical protein